MGTLLQRRQPESRELRRSSKEVKEEPVDEDATDELADGPDAIKLEDPLVSTEITDEAAEPIQNDELEQAEQVAEEPKLQRGRKAAKRKAR